MAKAAKPVPDGYHTITPYLAVRDGERAIEFYKDAFQAQELMRMPGPEGKGIGHAELQIGDSRVMLADEFADMNFFSPRKYGGSSVTLHLYVDECDAWVERAVAAGAKVTRPLADQFYGDRGGAIEDPYGHNWYISTHKEDLTMEEIQERAKTAHS